MTKPPMGIWELRCPKPPERKKVRSLTRVRVFVIPWSVTYQAPRSMGFYRHKYWSGLPFPSPRDLSDPGIKPGYSTLQADALPSEPPGKPDSQSFGCFRLPLIAKVLELSGCSFLTYFNGTWQANGFQSWPVTNFIIIIIIIEVQLIYVAATAAKSLQSCPTLCDPIDSSPPGSSVHGIFQARVLEWGAIAFSVPLHDLQLIHGVEFAFLK